MLNIHVFYILGLGYVLDYVPHLLGFLSIADLLEFKFVPDFEGFGYVMSPVS